MAATDPAPTGAAATPSATTPLLPNAAELMAHALQALQAFLRGGALAGKATVVALQNAQVRATHRQILIPLACLSLLLYLGFLIPARFLLWLLGARKIARVLNDYSSALARLVPMGVNVALRFLFYGQLDAAYLSVLGDVSPDLAKQLQAVPPRSYREMAWKEAKRYLRLLSFLPIYALLSMVPVVGRVLKWMFKCYTLAQYFDGTTTLAVAALSLLPLIDRPTTLLLQLYLAQIAALQETQLPYIGRVRSLSRRDEIQLVTGQDRFASLGYISLFTLLLATPYLGPLTCILSHAAAPVALVELMLPPPQGSVAQPPPPAPSQPASASSASSLLAAASAVLAGGGGGGGGGSGSGGAKRQQQQGEKEEDEDDGWVAVVGDSAAAAAASGGEDRKNR